MPYKVKIKGIEEDRIARSKGRSLSVSFKQSVELARALRGKQLLEAYAFLDAVAAMKKAVPYRRYNSNIPHRKGRVGPGRFPVKTALAFKKVLRNAEVNALSKGLDNTSLVIQHIAADKGASNFKPGRHRGRRGKSTHLEIVLAEVISGKKGKKSDKKAKGKGAPKKPSKKTSKKQPEGQKEGKSQETKKGEEKKVEDKKTKKEASTKSSSTTSKHAEGKDKQIRGEMKKLRKKTSLIRSPIKNQIPRQMQNRV